MANNPFLFDPPFHYPDDPAPWQLERSEVLLYNPPWLNLRQDHVLLPNGSRIDEYYIMDYPHWVNVIGVTRQQEIVLIRQYRHGVQRTAFELPAGVVDAADADLETAARRELLEETGFGKGNWRPWFVCSANPATHTNLSYTFLAEGVEQVADHTQEKTEDIRTHLIPIDQIYDLVDRGGFSQSLHVAPLLKYLLHQQRR